MRTFDWALFELYNDGHIGYEEALRNADSANELRLAMKLKSTRGEPAGAAGPQLSFDKEPTAEELDVLRQAELEKQRQRKREMEDQELEKKLRDKGIDSRFV
jgi:twitching motility protein PilU